MIETLYKSVLTPIAEFISSKIKDQIQCKKYIDNIYNLLSSNYKSRLCMKNILHKSEPVLFKDIYCPLSIANLPNPIYQPPTSKIEVKSVRDLMENINNLAIFGNAGSGKSTLVNYLYLNSVEELYKYPVMIQLRYLNLFSGSLVEYLKSHILGCKKIEGSDDVFSTLLDSGYFLFIFDGYDEIAPDKQYGISVELKELITNYPNNKYILTSRPLEQLYGLDSFHNFEIQPLTSDERNEFIKRQFPESRNNIAEKIIAKIASDRTKTYDQLLNTPLLIILCILNFELNSDLPLKKTEFYYRIFDTLFQGHDWRSKNGFERARKCNLQKEDYISVLRIFSFNTHLRSEYIFTKERLISIFDTIKSKKLRRKNIKYVDSSHLFNDLHVAINILIADGSYYTFPHKSFQEYFAVNHIINQSEKSRKEIYRYFISIFQENKGSLLTAPLLEMLYEVDQNLMIKQFIIPLLQQIKATGEFNGATVLYEKNVANILSIINHILYGEDLYTSRTLFSLGRIKYHTEEIDKLLDYLSKAHDEYCEDEDIFIDDL